MGRYISTTGTASSVIRTVNTTYSAIVNDTISVIDVTGNFNTNNVTLSRNGSKIQNLSEDLVLDINNVAITLIYSGSTYGWIMSGT